MIIKPLLIGWILALSCFNACAQDIDSLNFLKYKWIKKSIAPKSKLYTLQISDSSLFKSNQHLAFVEIKNRKKAPGFYIAYDKQKLIETAVFGKNNQAIGAINGTFFDVKNGGSVDFLKVNDTLINDNKLNKPDKRALHQKAAVVINQQLIGIKKWDGNEDWEKKLTDENVMVSGPLLIFDHHSEKLDSVAFNKTRHPRSAIGIKPNGNVLMFTVDGRQANSAGMSLFELAKIMKWLGCAAAINLDGGGSTTLWLDGIGENGVVNYPSDNKKWDHNGQRKVANVIFIKSKQ